MRGILTQVLVAVVMVTGTMAGSPSTTLPTKAENDNDTPTPVTVPPSKQVSKGYAQKVKHAFQIGIASWYGGFFHGRKTANGETYDMYQLTAAHRTLKLGTWVKVTNLRNGRWVLVRINDRGPVPQDRIIDLSYSAAQMLDMKARGLAKVRIDVMDTAEKADTVALAENPIAF